MKSEREPGSWLELPELRTGTPSQSLEMREEWIAAFGPLHCRRCGTDIRPGEAFRLAGYCAMGGVIPVAQFDLFADMLEPHAEHQACLENEGRVP